MGAFSLRLDQKGVSRLASSLKKAGVDMTRLKDDYRKMAGVVKTDVGNVIPVRTGRLKRSLRSSATQKSGVVRAGTKAVPYAGVINYGWPGHNIEAQHYMETGLMNAEDQVLELYRQALENALATVKGN